jgi:hypothetical protein
MSAPVSTTYMGRLHKALCEVLLDSLRGEPLIDDQGQHLLDINGRPRYERPTPQMLREIREFLKDNGIDQEPLDGTPVAQIASMARQYDDTCEPKLLN